MVTAHLEVDLKEPDNAKLTGAGGFIACVRVERRVMPFNWRRDMKAKHCDKCKHATTRETPKPTLICAVLHKPRFYAPVYWLKDTWGWKRNCDDYEELMLKHKIALDNV